MKKIVVIILVIFLLLCTLVIGTFLYAKNWYKKSLTAVGIDKEVEINIEKGAGAIKIATILEENKIIRNADAFKIYLKLNKINNLQAGKYIFNTKTDDVKSIVDKISKGEVKDDTITITFIEGKTIKDYAKVISEKTNNSYESILELLKNEEYIDSLINKYWFITDEIKNADIYYSLEGYIKPDTYIFEDKNVSIEYIFSYILNYTNKLLTPYKEQIENSNYTVHEILTLASIIEKEASNNEDMPEIAGVFYNRLNTGMPLGSDVTTYYAFQIDLSESDLTAKQLNTPNPYNTRHNDLAGKLPVGPICNPSEESIKSAIYPKETDCYYFVADKTGKTYFTKNYSEHTKKVKELKDSGMWYVYK